MEIELIIFIYIKSSVYEALDFFIFHINISIKKYWFKVVFYNKMVGIIKILLKT